MDNILIHIGYVQKILFVSQKF